MFQSLPNLRFQGLQNHFPGRSQTITAAFALHLSPSLPLPLPLSPCLSHSLLLLQEEEERDACNPRPGQEAPPRAFLEGLHFAQGSCSSMPLGLVDYLPGQVHATTRKQGLLLEGETVLSPKL